MSFVERSIEQQRRKAREARAAKGGQSRGDTVEILGPEEITIQPQQPKDVVGAGAPSAAAPGTAAASAPEHGATATHSAGGRSPLQVKDDSQIGQLLVSSGLLKEEDVRMIVQAQQSAPMRFGEAATRLGLVTPDDIQRAMSRQFEFPYLVQGQSNLQPALYTAYEPTSPATEAVRSLRSQLVLRWFKEQSKTLAVLGARAGAGASTLAANLAIVFAQLGERTLLVDANFRTPRQHELFGVAQPSAGLSNVLAGRGTLKEVMQTVPPYDNLSVLCAGSPPPNPQELLGRVNFSYVMETAPAVFDVVIVDAPPVLEFADAQLVAARAGASILVAHRHHTRIEDIERAKRQLAPSGTTLLGAVLYG